MVFVLGICITNVNAGIPWASGDKKQTVAPMLKSVMPGVVNISTKSFVTVTQNPLFSDPFFRRFFDLPRQVPRQKQNQSLGSGVIIDAKKGFVLTNNHVVDKADEITVTLRDGRQFIAKLIGTDPEVDLAVLQISPDKLTALKMANSDEVEVGDFVIAIGNPFGLGQTVTSGIVSALGRSGLGIEGYEDFIQTDASINPGNSGGALVDSNGKLVGINTAIVGPSGGNVGIGFAIPSNMVSDIMQHIVKYGEVRRGQLGVYIQDITPELAEALNLKTSKGAVIAQIVKNSPAEKAGIRPGDVVISVNGKTIKDGAQLRNEIGIQSLNSKLTLDFIRKGKKRRITVELEMPPKTVADAGNLSKFLAGVQLGSISSQHPLKRHVRGVEVLSITLNSPAASVGLRKGDIIVSVNQRAVENIEDVRAAAKTHTKGILLNIRRGNQALFLVVR